MAPWSKKKQTHVKAKAASSPTNSRTKAFTKQTLSPDEFKAWEKGSKPLIASGTKVMPDRSHGFKVLFQTLSRYSPVASAAVWTWQNLCSTKQTLKFVGGTESEREAAKLIINDLDQRITPFQFVKGGGMDMLLAQFFHYIFTYGRFSGNIVLSRDQSQIERFQIADPFNVRFTELGRVPFQSLNGIDYFKTNPNTFYYYGLDMDWENPYGSAMLEAAHTFMKLSNNMIDDLTKASSNAGVPRLHIKVNKPDKMDNEDDVDYVSRANSYFDSYVSQFSEIAADDNFYSWDDLQIGVVGGHPGASGFVWRINLQILDEEILSAFHLFPWIVGKSTQTTKNWVRSQFDLLMSECESLQKLVKRFSEWIRNTELMLHGITDVKAHQSFEAVRDPARKDIAISERFEISNVESKIKDGFISVDDGARELGYDKAYDNKLIFCPKECDNDDTVHKDDKADDILEGIGNIEELITNLTHEKEAS